MTHPVTVRPWLAVYDGLPATIEPDQATAAAMADSALRHLGARPFVHYFGRVLTGAEIERDRDALAAGLAAHGVGRGDRVALYLQNVPEMVIGLLAAWRLGAIVVPVNPMLRERELRVILSDSGAETLITLESLFRDVAAHVIEGGPIRTVLTTSPLAYAGEPAPAALAGIERTRDAGARDFAAFIAQYAGKSPAVAPVAGDDVALLVYTSGTTGPPKGAMVLHRNFAFSSEVFRRWAALGPEDGNLVLAPLFHITGLVAGLGASLAAAMPLTLLHRFEPAVALAACARWQPTFTVAAITAYTALMDHESFRGEDVASLRAAYSGGAPVPAAVVERWTAATGRYIHNAYGLTETTSPSHLTPLGCRAPVDPSTGTLAVGVPVSGTMVEVVDEQGQPLAPGEIGEFVTAGPQVVPGYWRQPEETRHAFPDGRLRTGDVGFMDDDGWFYLVDRRKDMIVAAGYKVWPREVEDVLYEHPAVREAAVVGVPDSYRGETVKAFVSLRPGAEASAAELGAFCKERLAAYKYPRQLEILEELPKTATGKILRRELRGRDGQGGV